MEMNQVLIYQGNLINKYLETILQGMIFLNSFTLLQMHRLHTSNDVFSRCKSVHKMAIGKSDDELIQLDNKMRIWTRSGKFRKSGKSRIVYGLVTKHDSDANDNIHDCVALHDANTNDHFHWHPHERSAHSLIFLLSTASPHLHTHRGSSVESFHVISIVMSTWVSLLDLTLPFYFLHFLTSLIFFLQFLKFVVNLHTPPNESMDSTDEFSLSTGYEPKATTSTGPQSSPACSSWTRRRSSPTKSLLRTPTTMTLHSKTCSTKHIERKPFTLYEKTCLSVCRRRQCPIERGDPLEMDWDAPVSTETQWSTSKKSKFLQTAKQELINTNFKQLEQRKFNNEINNFFKDNYYSKIWNYVKLIREVSLKWKSSGSFRVLHSTLLQDEN